MRRTFNPSASSAPARRRASRPSAPPGLKVRRVLVPLDFSGQSRQALGCAVPLAAALGAKISLLHVVQPPVAIRTLPDGGIAAPINTDRLVELARERLDEMAAELIPAPLRGNALVREGSPVYEITAAARALKIDLIVLSTHGFTGLKHLLLGSTAERVVRHAHCPVLTVRRRKESPERLSLPAQLPWKRLLVPLDFSLTSLRALEVAVSLARETGARLCLLHVVEPAPYAAGFEGAVLVQPERTLARNARKDLTRVAQRFVPPGVRVTCRVTRGHAGKVVAETAAAEGADLIVLSTHGHTGWERMLMGSTAEQVVRRAEVPVFVVRKPRT